MYNHPADKHPYQRRLWIAYLAFYLVFAASAARALINLWNDKGLLFTAALLIVYLVSLIIESTLITHRLHYLHVFNGLQTTVGLLLLLGVSKLDYFALLFIPPCAQSILNFPRKTALYWIGTIGLLMEIALLVHFPINESVGYLIIYPAAIFLFAGLVYLARESAEAQDRSEALLAELQAANQKLQAYAAQIEVFAVAAERNRLARELHDSVTQIIFGLTLAAQSARILLDRDPPRVATQLDHIQILAQNALTEMRALIQELHPSSSSGEPLIDRLRRLIAERQSVDGLTVDLNLTGDRRLPANIEDELLRITQEALNNIVKHAHTNQAMVTLDVGEANRVTLCIEDQGVGFDSTQTRSMPGHLGLTSMFERVQALGGNLLIDSQPGRGTRLRVELIQELEGAHIAR